MYLFMYNSQFIVIINLYFIHTKTCIYDDVYTIYMSMRCRPEERTDKNN